MSGITNIAELDDPGLGNLSKGLTFTGGGGGGGFGGLGGSSSSMSMLGSAASDFFGALGDEAEAGAYKTAAWLAQNDAAISQASGNIQKQAMQRQIYQTTSAQTAQEGGAGFAMKGSALSVRAASFAQGAIAKQLIGTQTAINVNSYTAEATADKAMASAASDAAIGGFLGSAFNAVGAFIPGA